MNTALLIDLHIDFSERPKMNIIIFDALFEAGFSFKIYDNRYINVATTEFMPTKYISHNLSNIAHLYDLFEKESYKLKGQYSFIELWLPQSNFNLRVSIRNRLDTDLISIEFGEKYPHYADVNAHEKAVNILNKYLNILLPSLRDKINIKEVECSSGDEYYPAGVPILVLGAKEILNYPVDLLDFSIKE
ncbi:MAG: hypothetical protein RIR11_2929 [Bacteroidota bacterium]|jgi:hypothetical protein